ncbi:MAG TPA: hypothetical protein VFV19_15960 [Candidatus Polarisedimenticolaceae bacterium]|nr:hypothetical protein [Candidatus Polarisedimenticolaceae bacterium]
MKVLALAAVAALSLVSGSMAAQPAGGVPFSMFAITNTQSVPMKVTLEAPAGTVVYGPVEVAADGSLSIDPKVTNIVSARVVVEYKDHGSEGQTVTLGGEKNKLYIKTLMASGGIGSVKVSDVTGSNP